MNPFSEELLKQFRKALGRKMEGLGNYLIRNASIAKFMYAGGIHDLFRNNFFQHKGF